MESSGVKHPFTSSTLVEIINLKYSKFLQMINELNSIAEYFLDDDGYSLSFSICKGTDLTFLWKLTVRIECAKSKVGETDIKDYRILRLNEFINIFNHIKQQSEELKLFKPSDDGVNNSIDSKLTANLPTSMTHSKLYDTIQSMSLSHESSKDNEICCICMEAKSNLILSCTHNYCENCIKEWRVSSNTCPICRSISNENDGFLLADKPDYYHIQDELSKSLFQITDEPKIKNKNLSRPSTNAHTSEEDSNDSD